MATRRSPWHHRPDMLRAALLPLILVLSALQGSGAPVVVSTSPGDSGSFEVVLSTDKDQPDWEKLEFKEGSLPKIWIRQKSTGKILSEVDYPGDANSDPQPLKGKLRVHWSPSNTRVAIEASQKGTYLLVFDLKGSLEEPSGFQQISFPAIPMSSLVPKYKEPQTLGYHDFEAWQGDNLIVTHFGGVARTEPRGDAATYVFAYSVTHDLTCPEAPVIKRLEQIERDH